MKSTMIILILMTAVSMIASEELNASSQLLYSMNRTKSVNILTTNNGAPVCFEEARNTLNMNLMQNQYYLERQGHLHRERIPERFVHARGSGAFGYFEVTNNITHICEASFLSKIGKKTPVAVRFSPGTGERGISELNFDLRSWACKFYTDEGNFDLLGLNTPTFFGNEVHIFHNLVHAIRRHPSTNLYDTNALWDAVSYHPESMLTFMYIFSKDAIPVGYQTMPGFGIHTYQLHNATGQRFWCKWHMTPCAGIKGLTSEERASITDPDYYTRSLYTDILNGNYPCWTVSWQILTEDDVKNLGSAAADVAHPLSILDYPLTEVGKICLNKNPRNYHADVEQIAFGPGNLVRGVDGALGKLFEARKQAYPDAQFYRLGSNSHKINVNCPFRSKAYTYNRDGLPPVGDNEGDGPNYEPNSFGGPVPHVCENKVELLQVFETRSNNTEMASKYYTDELTSEGRTILIENLLTNLKTITIPSVRNRLINLLRDINTDFGDRIAEGLNVTVCSSEK